MIQNNITKVPKFTSKHDKKYTKSQSHVTGILNFPHYNKWTMIVIRLLL